MSNYVKDYITLLSNYSHLRNLINVCVDYNDKECLVGVEEFEKILEMIQGETDYIEKSIKDCERGYERVLQYKIKRV
jgi:hypothetical protein